MVIKDHHQLILELLDWLANDFVKNGWDVKRTIRQIVTSKTYKQQSKILQIAQNKDPEIYFYPDLQDFVFKVNLFVMQRFRFQDYWWTQLEGRVLSLTNPQIFGTKFP